MIILFVIILISVFLFAFEVFPVDKTAMLLLVSMMITGLISPIEAISGFSNPALITILCLMIIAYALEKNGVIKFAVSYMSGLSKKSLWLVLPLFMFVTGGISAFINTTAVVIVFIKLINELHIVHGISKSRLLLPVSFAGILGGSCTLMGTSTNLIVNAIARENDIPEMSFFEFSAPGFILLLTSIVIVTIVGMVFLPDDQSKDVRDEYNIQDYITRLRVSEGSELIGKKLGDTDIYNDDSVQLLKLRRNRLIHDYPNKNIQLKQGDVLLIKTNINTIQGFSENSNFELITKKDLTNAEGENELIYVELLVLPNSSLIGKSLNNISRFSFRGSVPLAIKKRRSLIGATARTGPGRVRSEYQGTLLEAGDSILVETTVAKKANLKFMSNVMMVNEFDSGTAVDSKKQLLSAFILLIVIVLAATGTYTILKSALIGVFLLLLLGCVELSNTYQSINWQVIILLACMIPIGIAMKNTGTDTLIVNNLMIFLKDFHPNIIIAFIFLITMISSGFISNNAVAIIMTPVAIGLSASLNIPIYAFLVAVIFGANFSFFTPVGYQTNTIIYSLGLYKFKHFIIIGGILSFVLWLLSVVLIGHFFM